MTTATTSKTVWIKPHLSIKRAELIWALLAQDYSENDVASIFNISKQRVNAIKNQKPDGWFSPWIKIK